MTPSCWAFSVTENIESVWAIAGNKLVELAPQQIVDCDHVDQGCNGGNPPTAYEYVIKAGGLELESVCCFLAMCPVSCLAELPLHCQGWIMQGQDLPRGCQDQRIQVGHPHQERD
jgi:hypothetical protein